jgi:hypothetical protein
MNTKEELQKLEDLLIKSKNTVNKLESKILPRHNYTDKDGDTYEVVDVDKDNLDMDLDEFLDIVFNLTTLATYTRSSLRGIEVLFEDMYKTRHEKRTVEQIEKAKFLEDIKLHNERAKKILLERWAKNPPCEDYEYDLTKEDDTQRS